MMETVTRVSRKRSHEKVYAQGPVLEHSATPQHSTQLSGQLEDGGNTTSSTPTVTKKARIEKDMPPPSTSNAMIIDLDSGEETVKKQVKEQKNRSSPALILPGQTVTNRTFTTSNTTNPTDTTTMSAPPPAKKAKRMPTMAEKAQKAADAAQKATDKARAAVEKEKAERDAADAIAAKLAVTVGDDEAYAQTLSLKQIAEEKAAKAKLARDQAAEQAAKQEQLAKDLAQQAAEKQVKDAEKAKKALEKAEKERRFAAEKPAKDAEKAKKAQEKAERDAEKAKKDAKKEADKKSQLKLSGFFIKASTPDPKTAKKAPRSSMLRTSQSPAPSLNSNTDASEVDEAEDTSEPLPYNLIFGEFFLKEDTTLAPVTRFERDAETTQIMRTTIDSYISGRRSPNQVREYNAVSLFNLVRKPKRGRKSTNMKDLIAGITGRGPHLIDLTIDLTIDDQNNEIIRSRKILQRTPLKLIQFQEDVRPPYRGTYTHQPKNGAHAIARNPFRKDLPDQNYDVDSEAEWAEDEDAEDLGSDDDDEEEDDDEDMEDFLDDENDETAQAKRMVLQSDLEPVSTGLCWEDSHKRNTNVKMMPYRMEIILDPTLKSIDPLATTYWEPSPKAKAMLPPRLPLNTMNPPNAKPAKTSSVSKTFFTPASDLTPSVAAGSSQTPATTSKKSASADAPQKLIPEEDMPAFRAAIVGNKLTKVGLIEKLKLDFTGHNAAAITTTLTMIAHRVGAKKADKHWELKEDA